MVIQVAQYIAVLSLMASAALAQTPTPDITPGEQVFVQMSGKVAKEYASRCGLSDADHPGLRIETHATIQQLMADGNFRIEHVSMMPALHGKPRMVTLTAIVKKATLKIVATPKGTQVYASPAEHQNHRRTVATTSDWQSLRLELSDLKNVKIRSWVMVDEAGDLE